ncbi:MAG: J domain-containing protein [Enterovibrio sp.]
MNPANPNAASPTSSSAAQTPTQKGEGQTGAQFGAQVAAVTNALEQPQTGGEIDPSLSAATTSTAGEGASGSASASPEWKKMASDFFKPMTAKRASKKLDKGWKEGGIFRRLEDQLFELGSSSPETRETFKELLAPCKDLLRKINKKPIIWQNNQQLTDKICEASVVVLYAEDFADPSGTVGNCAELEYMLCYRLLFNLLRCRHLPWALDSIQPQIKDFLKQVGSILVSAENSLPENTRVDASSLAGFPLSLSASFSRDKCIELLGLPANAGSEEVYEAYRRLSQEHHPDRHPNNSKQATEMFLRVQIVAAALPIRYLGRPTYKQE